LRLFRPGPAGLDDPSSETSKHVALTTSIRLAPFAFYGRAGALNLRFSWAAFKSVDYITLARVRRAGPHGGRGHGAGRRGPQDYLGKLVGDTAAAFVDWFRCQRLAEILEASEAERARDAY
jgi:hypothetical protein